MNDSRIFVEKFEREPGIYIIFNKETEKLYIGSACDLKRRADVEHANNLRDETKNAFKMEPPNLREEFRNSNYKYRIGLLKPLPYVSKIDEKEKTLRLWETVFWWAAKDADKCIYNVNCPVEKKWAEKIYLENKKEIEEAKEDIAAALNRKNENNGRWINMDGTYQDFIELKLESRSLRDMYNEGKLDHLFIGRMGEYVGNNKHQKIEDIIIEKLEAIKDDGKCLWAGNGSNLDYYKDFINNFPEAKENLYALFSFTINKHDEDKMRIPCYGVYEGKKYWGTVPETTHKGSYKGLILENFWIVKEKFDMNTFCNCYCSCERATRFEDKYWKLPGINNSRQMQFSVSKRKIESSREIQKYLRVDDRILKELNTNQYEEKLCREFDASENEEHYSMYVLAEISDYVQIYFPK